MSTKYCMDPYGIQKLLFCFSGLKTVMAKWTFSPTVDGSTRFFYVESTTCTTCTIQFIFATSTVVSMVACWQVELFSISRSRHQRLIASLCTSTFPSVLKRNCMMGVWMAQFLDGWGVCCKWFALGNEVDLVRRGIVYRHFLHVTSLVYRGTTRKSTPSLPKIFFTFKLKLFLFAFLSHWMSLGIGT